MEPDRSFAALPGTFFHLTTSPGEFLKPAPPLMISAPLLPPPRASMSQPVRLPGTNK
ncbi:hypothetical protein CANARDRAFT_28390 [[Candida] arabinofermentans NRRL YB-2248]|uniref:Uncharacterized protein n=1 Tax=[Candida] arabinofermentans NRRL YB-2248 TaxID=983967 RepID=A0A1E4T1N9_9ASCO|nr:hypothetical protein CANARDRAFT_28390 [[Candida] arabinofermentans NRRL YB-2248]